MTTATTSRCAEYKGRKYRLLWSGKTKYGFRAHLAFFDGSKDFWCDGNAVRELDGPARFSGREMCAECGEYPGSVECSDSSGLVALCCRRCASMASYERSFA
jgi:hypothetical protein